MTRSVRLAAMAFIAAGVLLLAVLSPARASEVGGKRLSPKTTLAVHLPCVIGGPMQRVIAAFEAAHPSVEVLSDTYKPLGQTIRADRPEVVVTVGDTEVQAMIRARKVAPSDTRAFATNVYRIVAIVPAKRRTAGLTKVSDLANPGVKRIFIEDPGQSGLGARTVQLLKDMGLWRRLAGRVVHPEPGSMILSELLAGKADAAIVLENCFLSESGAAPRTIAVIGSLPQGKHPPIPFVAVVVKGPRADVGRQFVEFLVSDAGRRALRNAGLKPVSR